MVLRIFIVDHHFYFLRGLRYQSRNILDIEVVETIFDISEDNKNSGFY